MFKLTRIVLIGLLLAPAVGHAADAAQAFGARPAVLDASLSPDGQSIALIQPLAGGQASALFVAKLDGTGQPKPILTSTGKPDRLNGCGWVSNTRLICDIYMVTTVDAQRMVFTRVLVLNADGTKVQELSANSSNYVLSYLSLIHI